MIIGIDATMLVYQGSGVANYTYNLIKNLLLSDKKNQYRIFYSSLRKPKEALEKLNEFKKLGAQVFIYHFPPKLLNILWGKLHILPIEWLIGKCNVIFFSDFLRPPTLKGTKGITTIHDLTWKIYPKYHTQEVINAHQIKLQKTIKYGDLIIVDSQNTKNDLLNLYPQIDKKRIYVIYPGVDKQFRKIKDENKIKKTIKKYLSNSYLLTHNHLLYVGAIEPRKNLDIAIKMFYQLITKPSKLSQENHKNQLTNMYQSHKNYKKAKSTELRRLDDWQDLKFFIISNAGWKNEKIFQLVKDLKLENKVIFLGYVKDEDLPYFYSGAKATIYLSDYEGFGLPPIESAFCQTPVLLYKNSSLKELFNDQYPYAQKGRELETLIYLLKNHPNPQKYLTQNFSWGNSAKDFIKIINKL